MSLSLCSPDWSPRGHLRRFKKRRLQAFLRDCFFSIHTASNSRSYPSFAYWDVCGGKNCSLIENYGENDGPEIMIRGTTAVELTSGLHWYLKYWCDAHVSRNKTGGIQVASVPKAGSLPRLKGKGVMIQRPVPWNYYQNVVTSSYSYVWLNWSRWKKEIDWMALQGVNLPLAFTGQEAIWQKVFMVGWPVITELVGSSAELVETDIVSDV